MQYMAYGRCRYRRVLHVQRPEDGKPASETNPGGHVLVIYDDLSKQAAAIVRCR